MAKKISELKRHVQPHGSSDSGPPIDDDYMGSSQLTYFKQKLLNWRSELLDEVDATLAELRHDSHHEVGDEADRATREAAQTLELRTRDRYRKLLGKIDAALSRIDDGTYGWCEDTGEPIGLARLEARPVTTLCVEAQERRELRERLTGVDLGRK
ncbi:RNA polymerase-binding protein DksA [Candidatus Thiodiazotropha endoloripes]|uniref:RNA polymerase-binding protein DksA n=1 Tax=Candidatus Thiodiazotropha endoloripes TaxID=1818881 RepID=UPI00083DFBE4|nr:RNA polymerase-binding protein DksA [Candidatus Thiodiazotropha endoloripes]ODB90329.1 RNA polymerase-binding protein DksA [Candidatus Thiodiazotropha endoloripes]ODB94975.1 RNA polymerase-binding protein DksA [Candidatus Thiodiazotropha endoloripes]